MANIVDVERLLRKKKNPVGTLIKRLPKEQRKFIESNIKVGKKFMAKNGKTVAIVTAVGAGVFLGASVLNRRMKAKAANSISVNSQNLDSVGDDAFVTVANMEAVRESDTLRNAMEAYNKGK